MKLKRSQHPAPGAEEEQTHTNTHRMNTQEKLSSVGGGGLRRRRGCCAFVVRIWQIGFPMTTYRLNAQNSNKIDQFSLPEAR